MMALFMMAFFMMANALLSPKAAHQLVRDQFSKTKNGPGGNIPLDFALEHYNRLMKAMMQNLGPNASSSVALDCYCKALEANKNAMDNFDLMINFKTRSVEHRQMVEKAYLRKIVAELVKIRPFITTMEESITILSILRTVYLLILTCMPCSNG